MSCPLLATAEHSTLGNALITPLPVGIWWAVLFAICALVGRRQRHQVRASVGRLLAVAAVVAALAVTPALPALAFGEGIDLSWSESQVVREDGTVVRTREVDPRPLVFGVGYLGWELPVNVLVALFALLLSARIAIAVMRPAPQLAGVHGGRLPEVEDPEVLARVRTIAARVGARPPRLLRLSSLSGAAELQAGTGGSIAPVLIVSGAALDRLDHDDVAAILAHELAHVARHSFWVSVIAVFCICAATVLLSAVLPPVLTAFLGWAVLQGVPVILGHVEEPAADLRAARAVGFAAMARALAKVHAAHAPPCGPWLRRLLYATHSHPSEAVRRFHLRVHAPDRERGAVELDAREASRQRRTDAAVRALWVAAVGFAVAAGLAGGALRWYGIGALVAVASLAPVVRLAATRRRYWHLWRSGYLRGYGRAAAASVLAIAGAVVAIGAALAGLSQPAAWPTWVALAGLVALVVQRRRRRGAIARVHEAMLARDLGEALHRLDALPRRVRRRPEHRLMRATLLAAQRDDGAALAEVEALLASHPRCWPAHVLRCLLVRAQDPAQALAIAERVAAAVPRNPYLLAGLAQCLRRLGRLDEAETAIGEAIALDPDYGALHTIRAHVALATGDLARAAPLVQQAKERDPASTYLTLLDVELHAARGESDAALAALQLAIRAVEQNPLSLAGYELDVVRRRLALG